MQIVSVLSSIDSSGRGSKGCEEPVSGPDVLEQLSGVLQQDSQTRCIVPRTVILVLCLQYLAGDHIKVPFEHQRACLVECANRQDQR